MLRLLVADKNVNARKQIAGILIEAGYDVMVTARAEPGVYPRQLSEELS